MNLTEKIKIILQEYFSKPYCDTCRNTDDELICCECHHKYIMGQISEKDASDIADKIIEVFKSEQQINTNI